MKWRGDPQNITLKRDVGLKVPTEEWIDVVCDAEGHETCRFDFRGPKSCTQESVLKIHINGQAKWAINELFSP